MRDETILAELDDLSRTAARSMEGGAGQSCAKLAARLGEDGLLGVIAPEPPGLGLPAVFAGAIVAAAARHLLAFPVVETLAASALMAEVAPDIAAAVVAGEAVMTSTPSARLVAEGGMLSGIAADVPLGAEADWLLAPAGTAGGAQGLALIALKGEGVSLSPVGGLDPARPQATVRVEGYRPAPGSLILRQDQVNAHAGLELALRAADLNAAATAASDLAVQYISARSQFGRPLVSFQALRHDLARARMALESGRQLIDHALDLTDAGERLEAAELAYAQAAATCPGIAEMALQLHGGMGFTWDVKAHHYLRRIKAQIGARDAAAARERVIARVLGRLVA